MAVTPFACVRVLPSPWIVEYVGGMRGGEKRDVVRGVVKGVLPWWWPLVQAQLAKVLRGSPEGAWEVHERQQVVLMPSTPVQPGLLGHVLRKVGGGTAYSSGTPVGKPSALPCYRRQQGKRAIHV